MGYTALQRYFIHRHAQQYLRDFDESKHPRDDHGRFTDAGGGGDDGGDGGDGKSEVGKDKIDWPAEDIDHMKEMVVDHFPNMDINNVAIDDEDTPEYNCIGYAIGDTNKPWWPRGGEGGFYYWPETEKDAEKYSVSTFDHLLMTTGHGSITDSEKPEEGYVKLALFTEGDKPTHLARQLADGEWSSKVGAGPLIRHGFDIHEMDNGVYGNVAKIYKLKNEDWQRLRTL